MNTEELKLLLTSNDVTELVDKIKKSRPDPLPDITTIKNQLEPKNHDVMDETKRPNKKVKVDMDSGTETATYSDGSETAEKGTKIEQVARIAIAIQKLIVKRAVSFSFGNPISLNYEPLSEAEKTVLNGIKKILIKNKETSLNRKIARVMYSTTEVAEYWYPIEDKNTKALYGFDSNYKLRAAVFSTLKGDKLFPTFDDFGDMIAFSREFTKKVDDKDIIFFETYTDSQHFMWNITDKKAVEGFPKKIELGKIPIVYGKQEQTEWEDVQSLIDRLEKLLSNFADTNDYHASPKIFIKGQLVGFGRKGEAGSIIEGDRDSDAKYLSWQQAPEAVKLEIETLLNLIYSLTQTPNLSFESVKGLGNISGRALKLLFLDAHLKVQEKQEVLSEYLTRRLNLIKAFIGMFNSGLKATCDSMDIEPEIVPFMIDDEETKVDILVAATGGKPILSQKTAVGQLNYTNDSEREYELIKEEEQGMNVLETLEPTVL
jgi:SPP1 family phage portal protein